MNDLESIHNQIDIIGQHRDQARPVVHQRLKETEKALQRGEIKPNCSCNDHIIKVIAHAGNKSKEQDGVLKHEVYHFLVEKNYDFKESMEHGVFLFRIKVNW